MGFAYGGDVGRILVQAHQSGNLCRGVGLAASALSTVDALTSQVDVHAWRCARNGLLIFQESLRG